MNNQYKKFLTDRYLLYADTNRNVIYFHILYELYKLKITPYDKYQKIEHNEPRLTTLIWNWIIGDLIPFDKVDNTFEDWYLE